MRADLLKQVDSIPPAACRLCAHVNMRRKTLREISEDSGLSYRRVVRISNEATWRNVKVGEALAFAQACGVDLLRPRKRLFYLGRILAKGNRGIFHLSRGLSRKYVIRQMTKLEKAYVHGNANSANKGRGQSATAVHRDTKGTG